MISEKTVELNLTTELVNWLGWLNGGTYYTIAPSQRQEAVLGFDAAIGNGSSGVLIQYKRAYPRGNTWIWHLNRTKGQDQHQRLQTLEARGFPVFYALPYFSLPADIAQYRRRLLLHTFWFRPSQINPYGGPTGHHDICFDSSSGQWSVHSEDPVALPNPLTVEQVVESLLVANRDSNLKPLMNAFNTIVLDLKDNLIQLPDSTLLDDLVNGVSIISAPHA
jgi:hypothetical protein